MTGRRTQPVRSRGVGALAFAALLGASAAGCADAGVRAGRSGEITAPTTSSSTPPTTTTITTTTVPEITLPPTTAPPTTTARPPETAPEDLGTVETTDATTVETAADDTTPAVTTTTLTTVAGGWVDTTPRPGTLDPCCQFLWQGVPSPAFPGDPADPLADGLYSAEAAAWTASAPNELTVEVRRMERCTILGDDACVYGGPYSDADVSTAPDPVRATTIRLDEHVRVVLGGYDLCAGVFRSGNGRDIAELLAAFGAAYDSVIGGPLAAGTSEEDVLAGIAAAPTKGFETSDPTCAAGLLAYRHAGAPPLLLQMLTDTADDGSNTLLRPTDVIRLVSLDQRGGLTTLTFHAGFTS